MRRKKGNKLYWAIFVLTICTWISMIIVAQIFFSMGVDFFKESESIKNIKSMLFVIFFINLIGLLSISIISIFVYDKIVKISNQYDEDIEYIKEKVDKID